MQLSLLLPMRERFGDRSVAAGWLARGDRAADAAAGRDGALNECFGLVGELAVAALTRSIDAGDAAGALWLRADPAYVMADAVTLRLLACGNLGLSNGEVEAFARALRPLFAEAGFDFDAPHPQRWYLRCPRDAALPTFSAPANALGDDLANHLPEGDNARRWRGLLNEVQIVLTQHPINAQRIRLGLPPLNSLWFWGGGMLPESVRCNVDEIYSEDAVVGGLAKRAAVPAAGLGQGQARIAALAAQGADAAAHILADLRVSRDVGDLERDWFAPIDAALRRRAIGALHLLFESGERRLVRPFHRWRLWRRARSTA